MIDFIMRVSTRVEEFRRAERPADGAHRPWAQHIRITVQLRQSLLLGVEFDRNPHGCRQ
jgi:hypothetical protein